MRLLLSFLLAALPVGLLPAQQAPALKKAAETITPEAVKRHVYVIAADSMLGRVAPSRGLELTALYVVDRFKRVGLKPGGKDGRWIQRYSMEFDGVYDIPLNPVPQVVGILEGTDPALKDEYIVLSAHMDHLGAGVGGGADSIFNGADDNASGVAGLLELAAAFSQPGARPRRSLMFVAASGHERAQRPHFLYEYIMERRSPVSLKQVVASLNFEMIGRWLSDTVLVIGLAYSDLGATFERVRASHPELRLAALPNPSPERLHDGSDYRDFFAYRGVPVLKFGGPHAGNPDYHKVTDSPDKIEAEREARILRLAFYVVHQVANADGRPRWDPKSYRAIAGGGPPLPEPGP